ncbi:Nuclear pore complex protein Nup98-Nup96, partial [Stegodyphus mimosarum]
MDIPKPPENKSKGILPPPQMAVVNGQMPSDNSISNLPLKPIVYHVEDEAMEGITSLPTQKDYELDQTGDFFTEVYSPTRPILNSGIDPERIQGMKASFFQDDMNDDMWGPTTYKSGRDVTSVSKKDDANKENEVISFLNKIQTKSSEVFKKQRHYEYPDNQFSVSVKSPFKYGEVGIQKSMSSLSLSTIKQAEWLSSLPLVKTSSEQLSYPKKTVPILPNKISLRPFKQSVLYNKQHLLADAGYFMGRSFRCGWRADGIYVHLEPPKEDTLLDIWNKLVHGSNIPHSDTHGKAFMLCMTKLPTTADAKPEEKSIQETLTGILKLQLQNSVSTTEDGTPFFVPNPGVEPVHALAEFFENHLKAADSLHPDAGFLRQSAYVWNLLVSLWGTIGDINEEQDAPTSFPEDTPNYLSEGTSNYLSQMARREALSHWLIKTTENIIMSEVANCSQRNGYLAKIFLYMSGRRISDAVKLAQENHDYRLSLLLSQAEGNLLVRKLISNQLLNWEQNGAYKFIKYNRIALYALLSGMLIWENVYETVNCCKNLDWKQALALHLWYHCSPNSSIQDALKKYDESFQGTGCHGKYSMPPYPPYIDIKDLTKDIVDDSEMVYDTCYHLLKLYCDRSHRLDQLLMPETYSEDHLDYRLSWLLQLSLSSIGYNISSDLMCTLHMNFASQLESISMWPWAVFVLLHHPDKEWRIKYVKEILLRHVSLDQSTETEEKEKFLVEQLLVPVKWIFEAKAVLARSLGKHAEEAWYLLKAESWNESHSIVIKYLASDAVINEDYDYLMKYLSELALPERSCFILDWASGGQVYLDYINMCQVVQGVLSRETSAYDLEKFTPEVVSLCNRLSSIPTSSLKDRLSVAEMAKKTGTILRSIAMLQVGRTKDSSSLTRLGSILKNLPMP